MLNSRKAAQLRSLDRQSTMLRDLMADRLNLIAHLSQAGDCGAALMARHMRVYLADLTEAQRVDRAYIREIDAPEDGTE